MRLINKDLQKEYDFNSFVEKVLLAVFLIGITILLILPFTMSDVEYRHPKKWSEEQIRQLVKEEIKRQHPER